jgi:glycosidase
MKKLDYLQELGIGGIYLNPIFKARSNHKYDTGDYMTIDEMFGDEEIFRKLILEAEKRGIRIVLDGVFNHVGADSIYFNAYGNYKELGAAQSKDSKFYQWFNFFNYPYDYECWWGVKDLPNVNEHNDAYRNFIVGKNGVIEKWTKLGIGGWRLDVADEMPDEFIRDIRRVMDGVSKDTVLIGEVWEDASNKIAYGKRREYLLGDEIHGTMNYPFKESVLGYIKGTMKAGEVYLKMMSLKENYPPEAFYSALNNLGTHDTKRIFTEIDNFDQLKIAIGLLMTFPGVPCIYYGDEAGVKGESDPYNRGPYPWGKENEKIMEFYKTMIDMRKSSVAFTQGDFIPFYQENIFGYLRILDEEAVIVIVNRDPEDVRLLLEDTIGLESIADRYKHILSGEFHLEKASINIYKL